MMNWYGHGIGGWGYALTAIITILFLGAVIAGIVALVRYLGRGGQPPGARPSAQAPEQLLAERFARGEIDEDEYRRRLTALRATGPASTP
jgi:putative membrane protein